VQETERPCGEKHDTVSNNNSGLDPIFEIVFAEPFQNREVRRDPTPGRSSIGIIAFFSVAEPEGNSFLGGPTVAPIK